MMQFTLQATRRTPHGASRLMQAMPAWLVKTRRAPPRHGRDARVSHTTTAMQKLSTPPPPPSPPPPHSPFSPFVRDRSFSLQLPFDPIPLHLSHLRCGVPSLPVHLSFVPQPFPYLPHDIDHGTSPVKPAVYEIPAVSARVGSGVGGWTTKNRNQRKHGAGIIGNRLSELNVVRIEIRP